MEEINAETKKFCECGCSQLIPAISYGRVLRFKHGHNRKGMKPEENSQWKGGRTVNDYGYIEWRCVGHRRAHKPGFYVAEHVLVMESYLVACLCDWTIVHHKNEIKTDNRIENLEMMSNEQHIGYHSKKRFALGIGTPKRKGSRWIKR